MKSANPPFECIFAEVDNKVVGFGLFFQNYDTWQGQPGLFLADLYVESNHRAQSCAHRRQTVYTVFTYWFWLDSIRQNIALHCP